MREGACVVRPSEDEVKDVTLFDDLARKLDVPVELSPVCVSAMEDGLARFGHPLVSI